jgi:hypothetical protein
MQELDLEFGYCSEEDSVFHSFVQNGPAELGGVRDQPKIGMRVGTNSDSFATSKETRDVLNKYKNNNCEFLIKFKIVLSELDNSSVATVALNESNADRIPAEVIEFREKKKFLRSESRYFDKGNPFKQDIDE